jgi:hypothetical protein
LRIVSTDKTEVISPDIYKWRTSSPDDRKDSSASALCVSIAVKVHRQVFHFLRRVNPASACNRILCFCDVPVYTENNGRVLFLTAEGR